MRDYNLFNNSNDPDIKYPPQPIRNYSNHDYSDLSDKDRLYPLLKPASSNLGYDNN